MRLLKQKTELLAQGNTIEDMLRHIEMCGKICYKAPLGDNRHSTNAFVDKLITMNHMSVLEHGTIYMQWPENTKYSLRDEVLKSNPYTSYTIKNGTVFVTTNYRVILDNIISDFKKYLAENNPVKRYTVKVITNIGVSRELNRHRHFSISEQSTRYCNYSKDKFGNEVTFIVPAYWDILTGSEKEDYKRSLSKAEKEYFLMLERGYKAEQAREVLPLATTTEAVYTAFDYDWKHFLDLRLRETTGRVHPNMKELAMLINKEFEKNNITL